MIAAENVGMKDPQRVSNLIKFIDNYDWSGLEFPVSIKDISVFEIKNNISINVLAVEGRDIYIHRKTNYKSEREINLLRLLLTQRFLTFRCIPCVKIKNTDIVLPVKEGPQLP